MSSGRGWIRVPSLAKRQASHTSELDDFEFQTVIGATTNKFDIHLFLFQRLNAMTSDTSNSDAHACVLAL